MNIRVKNILHIALVMALLALCNEHAACAASTPLTSANVVDPSRSTEQARESDSDEVIAADSPRASVDRYLRLCNEARYGEAAHYLSIPQSNAGRGPQLARRLKAVLDSRFWIDLDTLSSSSEGFSNDQLPRGREQIGQFQGPTGRLEPLRLTQRGYPGPDAHWVFSQSVVDNIDDWYEHLDQRWFLDHLPPSLLRVGPRGLMIWQWLTLPVLILLSWLVGYLLSRITRSVLGRIASRTAAAWDDDLVKRLGGPLTLIWMLVLLFVNMPWLGLNVPAGGYAKNLIRGCFLFTFFWILLRLIEVWGQLIIASKWAMEHSASRSLVPLGVRVGKLAVLVIGVIALVSAMGYPAASLLAGLGVGGLAVALAAQKTIENLFGAFSIGADQPFREGDFIKIDDFVGTVETIGLRSTKIRTLDRTLISIPNGKLSEMRLESYTARDRLRLTCTLGLVYETTTEQMRTVLDGLEAILRNHPKIWPDSIVVRFAEFGSSSLDIQIMAWFLTADWNEFQLIRQEVLLSFMDCVQRAGSSFAFPTQTVYLAKTS